MVGIRKRRPGERTDPQEEKPVTGEEDGEEVIAQKREACRVIDQVRLSIFFSSALYVYFSSFH